jgi:hypothetical protein
VPSWLAPPSRLHCHNPCGLTRVARYISQTYRPRLRPRAWRIALPARARDATRLLPKLPQRLAFKSSSIALCFTSFPRSLALSSAVCSLDRTEELLPPHGSSLSSLPASWTPGSGLRG